MRGAYNRIATLSDEERRRGVITYSSGNHAQAVARAARLHGVAGGHRHARRRAAGEGGGRGARWRRHRLHRPGERGAACQRRSRHRRRARLHDGRAVRRRPAIIAGQGTCGLEIVEDLPDAGRASSMPIERRRALERYRGGSPKALATDVPASIGVEPELAADAQESLRERAGSSSGRPASASRGRSPTARGRRRPRSDGRLTHLSVAAR